MPAPIEMRTTACGDMFGGSQYQQPVIDTVRWRHFLDEINRMTCACCAVGNLAENKELPPVLHDGQRLSPIMVIGEAPGINERRVGLPFMGKAGDLLRQQLFDKAGLSRTNDVIFTNILKCRPYDTMTDPKSPTLVKTKDRTPSAAECASCMPLLLKQLEFMRPRVIVFLGETSACACLGLKPGFGITRHIGYGLPLYLESQRRVIGVVAIHTSYLLRNSGDLKAARENLLLFRDIKEALDKDREPHYYPLKREQFGRTSMPLHFERGGE